jgi:hypothetical protein
MVLGSIEIVNKKNAFWAEKVNKICLPFLSCPLQHFKTVLINIFVQFGFSSNITSNMVALTDFVKNFNFCGRLYFDSLVAKPLSDLYDDSSSNFW